MTEAIAPRRPHAALDPAGRLPKAMKIHHLLALPEESGRTLRLLEIGTGSGAIAHYFSQVVAPRFEVDAVDVLDQRRLREGYRFLQVTGTQLPFDDAQFDIVLSNHVIEHIGGRAEQAHHLQEAARVLRPHGQIYLATPNRWQVMEPHFKLPFLSWLPRGLRDAYVRLAGRGPRYDCDPLAQHELETLAGSAGLVRENLMVPALRELHSLEPRRAPFARWLLRLPARLLERLQPISPTHIYRLCPGARTLAGKGR